MTEKEEKTGFDPQYDAARQSADRGNLADLTEENYPELAIGGRLTFMRLAAIRSQLKDAENSRYLLRSDRDGAGRITAHIASLFVLASTIAHELPPGQTPPEIGAAFWIGGDERGAIDTAISWGVPEVINTYQIPALAVLPEQTILRMKIAAAQSAVTHWKLMEKEGKKIGLGPHPASEFEGLAHDEIAYYSDQIIQWTGQLRTMRRDNGIIK